MCRVHKHPRTRWPCTVKLSDNSPICVHYWNAFRQLIVHDAAVLHNIHRVPFDPLHNRIVHGPLCILVSMPNTTGTIRNVMQSERGEGGWGGRFKRRRNKCISFWCQQKLFGQRDLIFIYQTNIFVCHAFGAHNLCKRKCSNTFGYLPFQPLQSTKRMLADWHTIFFYRVAIATSDVVIAAWQMKMLFNGATCFFFYFSRGKNQFDNALQRNAFHSSKSQILERFECAQMASVQNDMHFQCMHTTIIQYLYAYTHRISVCEYGISMRMHLQN